MKKQFLHNLSAIIICLLSTATLQAQGWTRTVFGSESGIGAASNAVIETPGFKSNEATSVVLYYEQEVITPAFTIVVGNDLGFVSGLNPEGSGSGNTHIPTSLLYSDTEEANFLLTDKSISLTSDAQATHITKFINPSLGSIPSTVDWTQVQYENLTNAILSVDFKKRINDTGFITLAAVQSEVNSGGENLFDLVIIAADENAIPIWTQTYESLGNDIPVEIIPTADGNFSILYNKEVSGVNDLQLLRIDANGEIISDISLENTTNFIANDIIFTSDDAYVITGENGAANVFVLKTNQTGAVIWSQEYTNPTTSEYGRAILEDAQNHLIIAGNTIENGTEEENGLIIKITSNGTPLWEKPIVRNGRKSGFNDVILTPEGKYVFTGYTQLTNANENTYGAYHVQTDTFGIIKGGQISGNVFFDEVTDCVNVDELNLENWIVQAQKDTLFFYSNTDEFGNYTIPVDVESGETAEYTVTAFTASDYWSACENDIVVNIPYLDSIEVNFPMQALINCPFVETQITDGGIRPCESATFYVSYCNTGTSVAEDATVKVTLDEYLTYESASIPPTAVDGQTLTFSIGDLDINTCGDFSFNAFTDCDSVMIDDVLCLELNVAPDTICMAQPTNWSGALLQASAVCDEGNITFSIENTGTGGMATAQEYIIIEDAVLLMQDDFELDPGQNTTTNQLPIDGSIYHIIAPQEPGAPGAPILSIGTADCMNNSGEIFNQISQNNGNPFNIIYCPIVRGSFDPNDKQATPRGIGEENFISPNTDIQYRIRFQNTGTDTAFRVVLRDTLSPFLDPATIIPGASSHDYDWNLNETGHLTFNFYNIILPDSMTNPEASQGFVSFKIRQKENLEDYTAIENSAGIYFDFNEPVITNTVLHTVLEFVNINIINKTVTTALPKASVSISPNPMQDGAWLKIEGLELSNNTLKATVFDMTGKAVYTAEGLDDQVWLPRKNMLPGVYFFSLENTEGWLASGKLIVQ
ncbi:MAG: putative repeat protein (TIGR01451 family) [Saprospiraceae bacterium]|jgi:uncharacterized repeat protein (TIGR01451 family)